MPAPFIDHSGHRDEIAAMMIWLAISSFLALTPAQAQTNPVASAQPVKEAVAEPVATISNPDAPVEKPVVCFSAREMSDRVARLRLANPLIAMQSNARRNRAEPLRTRLCRSGNRLVYEVSLIRQDGKVMQIYLNAQSGRTIAPPHG